MTDTIKRREAFKHSHETDISHGNLRYGPLPTFPKQNKFARMVIVMSLGIIVYFYSARKEEKVFASSKTKFPHRTQPITCSDVFQKEISHFKDCVPRMCGRGVYDELVTTEEISILRSLAERGLALGSPSGGAAILDLQSGALSYGTNFINLYKLPQASTIINLEDFEVYKTVRTKIQHTIAAQFNIESNSLHFAHPTFFSKLTALDPKTIHDEYWHVHIDKETYQSFHYTALLYLSDYEKEFEGGRFVFIETDNSTSVIEPSKGRVLLFTSGGENPHKVERVSKGQRIALTVAFTCDASRSLPDPILPATKPLT